MRVFEDAMTFKIALMVEKHMRAMKEKKNTAVRMQFDFWTEPGYNKQTGASKRAEEKESGGIAKMIKLYDNGVYLINGTKNR